MHWLHSLDVGVLRFINQTLSNPVFDAVMPFVSGRGAMQYFFPVIILGGLLMIWKGGVRGRLCALMLVLIIAPGDAYICNAIKHAVGRPRPGLSIEGLNALLGTTKSFAMPSSHAANWFAATMIFLVYFRRSWWIMLPLACLVSFSRVYNGVHYPSDVIAGAIIGAGYAATGMLALSALWQWIGKRWFPLWLEKLPSLIGSEATGFGFRDSRSASPTPMPTAEVGIANVRPATIDQHWVRLGYLLIIALFIGRLAYIASGLIELSQDEAYQWTWSKHLALSYYSKPPLIAYTQFLGTHLWGDTEFGIRFFSPVLAAVMSLFVLQFMARVAGGRAAFALLLAASTTPLLSVGSTLMTVDPLSVAFWVFAMIAGWRAAQPDSTTKDWVWVGVWMGLGFLSKYTELLQWLCWAIFFIAWKPARQQLRRPGPYVALGINLLCAIPVLIWNFQHKWITVSHVAVNAGLHGKSSIQVLPFLGAEWMLMNPVYFISAVWAAVAIWRSMRDNALALYLFSMGTPLFLVYFFWSFHSEVKPNWIAPAVIPMFCLMILYWNTRPPAVARRADRILAGGVVLGAIVVVFLHDTDLIGKIAGRPLPPKPDPFTRVRAWKDSALLVEQARQKLEAEGKPAFIICNHYGTTGLFTFYSPAAKSNLIEKPLVYCLTSDVPENQFFFWPGYREQRKGENAIFIRELSAPSLISGWFPKWLAGETNLLRNLPRSGRPPPRLAAQFESVTDLGQFNVLYHGRVFHTYQMYECRNLR